MTKDSFISELSHNLQPVKAWRSPFIMTMKTLVPAMLFFSAVLLVSSPMANLILKMQEGSFWAFVIPWFGLVVSALNLIWIFVTPGQRASAKLWVFFYLYLAALILVYGYALLPFNQEIWRQGLEVASGLRCSGVTEAVALLFGVFAGRKLSRGLCQRPWLGSALLSLVALGGGSFFISADCGNENGMHIVLWHLLVPAIGVLIVSSLFRRVLFSEALFKI